MKKIIASLFAIGFIWAGVAFAQAPAGIWPNFATTTQTSQAGLDSALQEIYKNQNVSGQSQLDCAKVSDPEFEKLGDAYMSVMLPNEQQHQTMDNMMGGEGSASLRQAHINMGRSYLGCWANYNGAPTGMMGYFYGNSSSTSSGYYPYGMMNGYYGNAGYPGYGMMSNFGPGWNMMGGYGTYGWFGWITMILIWALLILGITAVMKWLKRK